MDNIDRLRKPENAVLDIIKKEPQVFDCRARSSYPFKNWCILMNDRKYFCAKQQSLYFRRAAYSAILISSRLTGIA